ncbi:WD40/YVTN/BNR-like repeat-containing protein [Bacillus smithii]|uniref:WD40/YVTN/BNR-like repeat-containing protein n=1 Tax=Bacillus smithii TaxID=1479 RepID=UPI003D191580
MAVGYKSHAIYVINEQPNSKMDSGGLFYSTDDAKTWNKSITAGLNEEPTAIAVHPTNEKMVVIGTKNGLFVSNDFGNHFKKVIPDLYITALYFNEKGDLYIAGVNSSSLIKINVNTKEKQEINIPALDNDDAISYIAQNPTNEKEIVIATFKKNVYLSSDSGENWTKIADQGKGISQK